ncbi:MAG TPA: beta-galactosidase, partial [Chthoniobacteraceae bacterium]|nr:beta-galactosidase [Chthoniobacteraceae bacterium]
AFSCETFRMTVRSLLLLPLLALLGGAPLPAAEKATPAGVHFAADGIDIDAGSVGKFTLEYPALLDSAQKPAHNLLEKIPAKTTVVLKYEGGAQVELSLGAEGKVVARFSQVPGDVKNVEWNMHIPISFNQGGSWQAGAKGGPFPKEKPAKPHLLQDHADALTLTNYEGRSLVLGLPQYTFLQLSDNREWNWAIFHFKGVTPFDPNRKELVFTITLQGGSAKAAPLVDEFGQATRETWPDKVKSLDELKADVAAEKAYYASLTPQTRGKYGGLIGSQERFGLKATGFFHVEKQAARWLLVDPAGQLFFHLGLCSANPNEDYTLVKGRESAYAWLPPRDGEFATAWKKDSGGTVFSFHLANQIRKYGQPYESESYSARMIERMKAWGFNSIGAFSGVGPQAQKAANLPGVAHLPLDQWHGVPRIPGIEGVWDPFEEKTRRQIEKNFAETLPARANDPLIIGYFIANEPIYENIQHIVPTLKASASACKQRFMQELATKYKTIDAFNTAWKLEAKSFDDAGETVLPVETPAAKADVQAFTGVFFEEMFKLVAENFRKHDPNHLLLGCRLQPGTIDNETLCRTLGKYVDVMSFNYYTNGVDRDFLRKIYAWTGEKPMMLSEFYWAASRESGLAGGREVPTQQERGLAYRNYVEQSAALGFVVGIEWFTLVDQSVTGRWFQGFDGERANTGLLSVTDRPWKPMLQEMMKTNEDIYGVWVDGKAPFAWNDPRFRGK